MSADRAVKRRPPAFLVAATAAVICVVRLSGQIDFQRDVQPILREHCISCHGAGQQMSGLRLDRRGDGERRLCDGRGAGGPGHRAYRRGLEYLLRTQIEDGSWIVETRAVPIQACLESGFPYGVNQWISAAATGWATTALALAKYRLT
jgi:hypothetical protein